MLQLQDLQACTFLVELQLNRPSPTRGSDMSTWEVKVSLLHLFTFPSVIVLTSFLFFFFFFPKCSSGNCSTALPGQGALSSHVPVVFHPVPLAGEECIWHVQAA
jgi:hypothetical protein